MSVRGVFVTGTDTGVGKTVVAAALLAVIRRSGIDAVPMKPVQTGGVRSGDGWIAPDIRFCLAAAGLAPSGDEERLMAPYCFEPECSPHLAAANAEAPISLDRMRDDFAALKKSHDLVVVEGAGGVLVPLSDRLTMLDLMTGLRLPVILVARPGLGTINHTLLSLRELMRAGLRAAGIVIDESRPTEWGMVEEDNLETIERMGNVPVLGVMRFIPGLAGGRVSADQFHRAAAACLPPARALLDRLAALS